MIEPTKTIRLLLTSKGNPAVYTLHGIYDNQVELQKAMDSFRDRGRLECVTLKLNEQIVYTL